MLTSYRVHRLAKRCDPQHDFLQEYLNQFKQKPAKSTPIEALRMLVLDTETTGLNPKEDRILSIGTVAVEDKRIFIRDSLNLLVANAQHSQAAISIHGIIPNESAAGNSETAALSEFMQQLGTDVIVAHHAAFDVTMIEKAIQRHFLPGFFLFNPVLDTVFLTKKLAYRDPDFERFQRGRISLDDLCAHLEIEKHDRHTAWEMPSLLLRYCLYSSKSSINQDAAHLVISRNTKDKYSQKCKKFVKNYPMICKRIDVYLEEEKAP